MPNYTTPIQLSRRSLLQHVGQLATLALLGGCTQATIVQPDAAKPPARLTSKAASAPPLAPIQPTLAPHAVPLAHKIGQMIVSGFTGSTLNSNSAILQDIRNYHLGGVFLFARNLATKQQVTNLTQQLQAASGIPLTIAIDHEGGLVRRMGADFGFKSNYTAQRLGDMNDLGATKAFAGEIAFALAEMGINHNLAPVVDVNVNANNPVIGRNGRSFSADPQAVARHAAAFIDAHHAAGVLCTLKHFPGHGSSTADSHLGLVDVTATWDELELKPFQQLIRSGRCDAIMTAHIFNAKVDQELPATLSKAAITGLLRRRLGYNGVIMTDDLQMGAIQRYYDLETATTLALEAGVDMLSLSKYAPRSIETIVRTIVALVESGAVSEARIDESYRRILAMKSNVGMPREEPGAPRAIAQEENSAPPVHSPGGHSPDSEQTLENFRY